jgi:hypothetical protein
VLEISRTIVHEPYIYEAIDGCRLSYGSNEKMDTAFLYPDHQRIIIGPVDRAFCEARITAWARGDKKMLNTIPVSVWLRGPLRWFVELDTHKVGTTKQSSSLMHRLAKLGELKAEDFTPTTDPRLIEIANEHYRAWVASGGKRHSSNEAWTKFQDAIGRGYLYTAHWHANYRVLRELYPQRRDHRMADEWDTFCDWIESLPHSWLITYKGEKL